jgi:acyl-CoA thioesterase-1
MVKCSSTPRWLAAALVFFMLSAVPGGARGEAFKLLVFGDSLTHGYGLAAPDSFPAQLEARLTADGWPVTVVNAGNSGDTTAAGLARVDWSLAGRPDGVIVELGRPGAYQGQSRRDSKAHRPARPAPSAYRNARAAQPRARLRRGLRSNLSGSCGTA